MAEDIVITHGAPTRSDQKGTNVETGIKPPNTDAFEDGGISPPGSGRRDSTRHPSNLLPTLDFLSALYGQAPTGHLAVWTLPDKKTRWFPVAGLAAAAQSATSIAGKRNVYFGVGLQRTALGQRNRGEETGVVTIPGLWADIDVAGPAHKNGNLPPSIEAAETLARKFPLQPTIIVHSGHGLQVYWLFKNPWVLDSDDPRNAARGLSDRFQSTLQAYAAEHGWQVDSTSDLSRVLRVPGTWNRKLEPAVPVMVLEQDLDRRYDPGQFEPHLVEARKTDTDHDEPKKPDKPALIEPIIEGCAWLQHCRDDASTLPEPEWYAMVSIVGRCENGEQTVHDFSQPHPKYTAEETQSKLRQGLEAAGPRTCADIENKLNGKPYCSQCPHRGKIKSPIVLGNDRVIRRVGGTRRRG